MPTIEATMKQAPGLTSSYVYFDGEVEVYGRKGAPGDFERDPKFTPALISNIKSALIEGLRTGQRTSCWETIVELALDSGIAWKSHIKPNHAGAHPDNRGKFGLDAVHCQELGSDIKKVGWSWKKSSDSSCIQAPPEPCQHFGFLDHMILKG